MKTRVHVTGKLIMEILKVSIAKGLLITPQGIFISWVASRSGGITRESVSFMMKTMMFSILLNLIRPGLWILQLGLGKLR